MYQERSCPKHSILVLGLAAGIALAFAAGSLAESPPTSPQANETVLEALQRMPKIDAHVHVTDAGVPDEKLFFDLLKQHNMKWLDICVVGLEWKRLQQRIAMAESLHKRYPHQIAWATSFNLENWGRADWQKSALETLAQSFAQGAVAVKVWKEIGMVLKDPDGRYVMIDDPRFDPIFDYIEKQNKTLVAHVGEPRDCWLPAASMQVEAVAGYYKEHPQYYGYLHPEIPGYGAQIKARDHVLEKHPHLRFVGCHLGSVEHDVDELAKRFDKYPNMAVDMAGRVVNFQAQDREKVRNFLIKYQDRLLYGTDNEIGRPAADARGPLRYFERVYRNDYLYFATHQDVDAGEVKANLKVPGLALPLDVLKKIYYENAVKWYPGI
jgi:predicted TIM-barrel fold metal-dependent hydrolase